MEKDLFQDLPSRQEIGKAIVETSRRARLLRSLYRVRSRIDAEAANDSGASKLSTCERLAESPINSTEREKIAKLIDCAKAKGLHLTTGSAIQEGRSDEV